MPEYRNIIYKKYNVIHEFETKRAHFFKIYENYKFKIIKVLKKIILSKKAFYRLQKIQSNNLIQVYDIVQHNKFVYLKLEYFENSMPLREFLKKDDEQLSLLNISNILYQVANSIDFLHRNNLVHLDIIDKNILINQDLEVKLNDFDFIRTLNKNNMHSKLVDKHLFISIVYRIISQPFFWSKIKKLDLNFNKDNINYSDCKSFINSLDIQVN